ncbi:DUF2231 domain-containing protein [Sinosporangium siamense]|uniref:DUF2231 domain-containing protein n=1 Tax=Sinosporangium siamense TaxID=1367973 RepID=A0A919RHN5_9ACTN|nr:DUF2231 domain-containing protein [Sinosporangium siamense]GII92990.1 hypothetical protein Ssi02_32210 [Sinosporangium siamense]
MIQPHQAKQPVSAAFAGPYGHPFHPMLVTIPIGAWVAGLVFDIASQFAADPRFLSEGAMWLIAIGVIGALGAAMAGFLDLFAIPGGTRAFRLALTHMTLNLLVIAAYLGNFLWRHSETVTGGVPAGPLALNVAAFLTLAVSGWLGGRLSFRYGVRVADEATQAEGFVSAGRTN